MKKLLLLLCCLPLQNALCQIDTSILHAVFYNVENLFHPENDSTKNDDAFTPAGENHWGYKRYFHKINHIAKVFIAAGQEIPPALIGLAEVENDRVLQDLCRASPLKKYGYQFVHYDSPDVRGIDVALLYLPNRIQILHKQAIPIKFPFDTLSKNRDILYVKILTALDTLHLFINHWTSRYGGYAPTSAKRNHYASVLRQCTDSILFKNTKANILIMGDFNDYPTDESLFQILQAVYPNSVSSSKLYNLMLLFSNNTGTHKHEDFWGCLDQFIVSEALLYNRNGLQIVEQKADIIKESFLVEPDLKYGGEKVVRTYLGPKYIGGFSDHLPIQLKIKHLFPPAVDGGK